jgi:GNAT superfamily N-acetyltransferase
LRSCGARAYQQRSDRALKTCFVSQVRVRGTLEDLGVMKETAMELIVTDKVETADRNAILQPLMAFNQSRVGPSGYKELGIWLRNPAGETVGGLAARLHYDWLYIELIFVPQAIRKSGIGSQLLQKAEAIAIESKCVGIWLDTFSFQARGFYERNGYHVFGTLDDHPRGAQRFFLRKMLTQNDCAD